jgi:DNA polymerase V
MLEDQAKISFDELLNIRPPGTYLIKVKGDSMQGAGIFFGDILIVDKGLVPADRNIVKALIDREPTVEYLTFTAGMPALRSANPKCPPRFIVQRIGGLGRGHQSLRDHSKS